MDNLNGMSFLGISRFGRLNRRLLEFWGTGFWSSRGLEGMYIGGLDNDDWFLKILDINGDFGVN